AAPDRYTTPLHDALPICLLTAGACLAWGIDNHLSRELSASDPVQIAMIKGLAAGSTNLALALLLGANLPPFGIVAGGAVVGFLRSEEHTSELQSRENLVC